jgi:hypothetical protein
MLKHRDLAIFENSENHDQRPSFDFFRPRARDGAHGACLPFSFAPYLMHFKRFLSFADVSQNEKSAFETQNLLTHLLYTRLLLFNTSDMTVCILIAYEVMCSTTPQETMEQAAPGMSAGRVLAFTVS